MLKNDLYKPWAAGKSEWGIEIIDGEFSGTVIQIEDVSFNEDDSLKVEYHVINGNKEDLSSNSMFIGTFELIINDILKEAIENYEQNRDNDPKESGTQ